MIHCGDPWARLEVLVEAAFVMKHLLRIVELRPSGAPSLHAGVGVSVVNLDHAAKTALLTFRGLVEGAGEKNALHNRHWPP